MRAKKNEPPQIAPSSKSRVQSKADIERCAPVAMVASVKVSSGRSVVALGRFCHHPVPALSQWLSPCGQPPAGQKPVMERISKRPGLL